MRALLLCLLSSVQLISDRITFLSLDDNQVSFYRQINLGVTKFITGLRVTHEVMLLTSKQWSVQQELGRAEVAYITLNQLIDNVHFTYPDFSKKLQAGLRYRFMPLVTGTPMTFFCPRACICRCSFAAPIALLLFLQPFLFMR